MNANDGRAPLLLGEPAHARAEDWEKAVQSGRREISRVNRWESRFGRGEWAYTVCRVCNASTLCQRTRLPPYSTQIITSCAPLMHHMPGTLAPCRDRAIIHPAHSKLRPRFCTLHAAAVLSVLHPQGSCIEKQYEVGKVRFQHASEDASMLSGLREHQYDPDDDVAVESESEDDEACFFFAAGGGLALGSRMPPPSCSSSFTKAWNSG